MPACLRDSAAHVWLGSRWLSGFARADRQQWLRVTGGRIRRASLARKRSRALTPSKTETPGNARVEKRRRCLSRRVASMDRTSLSPATATERERSGHHRRSLRHPRHSRCNRTAETHRADTAGASERVGVRRIEPASISGIDMTQNLLPFAVDLECTCQPTCDDMCRGECGCEYCWACDDIEIEEPCHFCGAWIRDTCKARGCGTIHQEQQSEADKRRDRRLMKVERNSPC